MKNPTKNGVLERLEYYIALEPRTTCPHVFLGTIKDAKRLITNQYEQIKELRSDCKKMREERQIWIHVMDALPKPGTMVLVSSGDPQDFGVGKLKDGKFYSTLPSKTVLYWMPIPDLPGGGSG